MAFDLLQTDNVHVDTDLTNLSVGFGNNEFVAEELFPMIPVKKNTNTYPVWGMDNYIAQADQQGDKGLPKEVERTFRRASYVCERHALREFIGDHEREMADDAIQVAYEDAAVVAYLKELIELNREIAVKDKLATSGDYASGLYENMDSVGDRNFDDASGPGALKTLLTFRNTIRTKGGARPDIMAVSEDMWPSLSTDSSFFGGGSVNVALTKEQLADLLHLRKVITVGSQHTTANPKKGGAVTLTDLWTSNSIWMMHSPPGITKNQPSIGKLFMCNGTPQYNMGQLVQRVRDELTGDGGTWIVYKQFYDACLTALNTSDKIISGAFLQNCYIAL